MPDEEEKRIWKKELFIVHLIKFLFRRFFSFTSSFSSAFRFFQFLHSVIWIFSFTLAVRATEKLSEFLLSTYKLNLKKK